MKKAVLVFAVSLSTVLTGCEKREPVSKEPETFQKPSVESTADTSKFMVSEKDRFNPGNGIESIRKKRLTKFGRLTTKPPNLTTDQNSVDDAINKGNFQQLKVSLMDMGSIEIPSFPFDYENDIQSLRRLYKEHNLNEIINPDMNSMDIAQALSIYTYNFLKDGTPPSEDTWMTDTGPSAFLITKLRKEQGIGGRSEHYAALLCQLSLACGFVSRMVGMHVPNADGTVSSHTVCELFINVLDKWVVFDPYSKATYYMRDDLPLSALELRELMFKNLYRDITTVVSVGDFTEVVSVREKLLPLYRYLYIWRMNDIIGKSAGKESISWAELFQTHLVWEDEYSLVSEGNFDKEIRFAGGGREDSTLPGVRYVTHNVSDFYWKINQVLLHFDRIEDEKLRVFMDSMTPNFSHFIIRIEGGERTEVMKKTTNVFDVDQIMVNLTVSGVNTLGVPGQLTEINIAIP